MYLSICFTIYPFIALHVSIYHIMYLFAYIYLSILEVEDDYKGPRLDGTITLDFMTDLLEWFKSQKILHKKYAYKIILQVKEIFASLPSLVDVAIPEVKLTNQIIFYIILIYLFLV